MHPEKAEFLAELREDYRDNGRDLRDALAILVHPAQHGLATNVNAAWDVVMCSTSALMLAFSEWVVSGTDDSLWTR